MVNNDIFLHNTKEVTVTTTLAWCGICEKVSDDEVHVTRATVRCESSGFVDSNWYDSSSCWKQTQMLS